jgi:hypothetical protein
MTHIIVANSGAAPEILMTRLAGFQPPNAPDPGRRLRNEIPVPNSNYFGCFTVRR